MSDTMYLTAKNETETEQLGARLAQYCPNNFCIYLEGNLGAGKTTFSRGFLRGLNYRGNVKSPTYTLVEAYEFADKTVYHFDLYRIADPEELAFMGIEDYFTANSVCLIEWPNKGLGLLPEADLSCYIDRLESGRQLRIIAGSDAGIAVINQMNQGTAY